MAKSIPLKCQKCAMLDAAQAQALHGAEGDGCWNPKVCYSRRSYARNRDRIALQRSLSRQADRLSQTRSRKRKEAELEQIPVEFEPLSQTVFGVLVVYRQTGTGTPVHGIAAEIWQGQEKVAIASRYGARVAGKPIVPAVPCAGLVPSQVHQYVGKMLVVLAERYGIRKFASQTRLDSELCPIRPCPLHG